MPIHNWTLVEPGIFHHFHHSWISETSRALNRGLLPQGYYAMAEQIAGGLGPDVLTLQLPPNGTPSTLTKAAGSGIALATAPPRVQFRMRTEIDIYAEKANAISIRHCSNHEVIAMLEIVSPGNKSSRHGLRSFVEKATEMLRNGIHLLIIDLFPPTVRDSQGIHKAIWDEFMESDFMLPADTPLTLVAYIGSRCPEAFVQPTAVGASLPEMPLFIEPDEYVPVPLESTYQSAWEAVPAFWRDVLESDGAQAESK